MINNNTNTMSFGLSAGQLQLSNTLRRLWMEHVMWTRSVIISAVFSLPDSDAVSKRLLQNPIDFAAVLRPFYGSQKAQRFEELLTEHLLIAAGLVSAVKAGDAQKAQEEHVKWYANADGITNFLWDINPFWSKDVWRALLYDHLKMTEDEAVQILTGKYEQSVAEYDSIQAEALKMADYMSSGIIRQFMIR